MTVEGHTEGDSLPHWEAMKGNGFMYVAAMMGVNHQVGAIF